MSTTTSLTTGEELSRLLRACRLDPTDDTLYQQLQKACWPMINAVAWEHRHSVDRHSYQDLLQEGKLGLLVALNTFEERKGVSFRTWAFFKVRAAMIDFIRESNPQLLRQARSSRREWAALEGAEELFLSANSRMPVDDAELASFLGCEASLVHKVRRTCVPHAVYSMEGWFGSDESGVGLEETLASDRETTDPALLHLQGLCGFQLSTSELEAAISILSPRRQLVLRLYFLEGMTLQAIADRLEPKVSEGRVSQIRLEALAALRKALGFTWATQSDGGQAKVKREGSKLTLREVLANRQEGHNQVVRDALADAVG